MKKVFGIWLALAFGLFAERPNILFIFTDDQSHRTVGCYQESYDWVRTPQIDRLAEKGVRFEHAFIGTWCMPSRATILTGRHPHAIESMRMEGPYPGCVYDPEVCQYWPKVFRKQGYVTAHIGKWHTGIDTGRGRDWDYQIVWNRPNLANETIKTDHQAYFYDQLVTYADGSKAVLKEYSTDAYTRWAEEFIRGKRGRDDAKGEPWFLWLCYGAVHSPFTPADRHEGEFEGVEVEEPEDLFPPREGKPDWVGRFKKWRRGENGEAIFFGKKPEKTLQEVVAKYHEGVLGLDEAVGRLVTVLEETGQLENTMIVFTSDQGYAWGQHGLFAKQAPYDATIRAPLIVSWPGKFAEGAVCESPVGGVDLVPTFFRQAGIDLPWKMHGHDLTPLLEKPEEGWDRPVVMSFQGSKFGSDTLPLQEEPEEGSLGVPWYVSIRKGRFKYVRYLIEGELDELYDLDSDPEELKNLVLDESFEEDVKRMREELFEELKRTEAPFIDVIPMTRTEMK